MEWNETPESSNISRFKYDEASQVLTVEFHNGGMYNYYDVPNTVYEQMQTASSKGKFLAQAIKGTYRYAKV